MRRKAKPTEQVGKCYFTVEDPIFHRTVHVLLNYSAVDFTAWAHKHGDTGYQRDARADANLAAFSSEMAVEGEPSEWIICLKDFNWTTSNQGTLIHEIVHTTMKIFAMNNIPFVLDTQEFIAQTIGNLYEDIAGKIHRVRKKRVGR